MNTIAIWLAFGAMTPLMAYTGWHDVRHLKIPNWIPMAAVAIYTATMSWGIPFETFLWGLGGGAIALLLGFLLYAILDSIGIAVVGAGDLKLIAALVPFMWMRDSAELLVIFTIVIWTFLLVFIISWKRYKRTSRYAALDQQEKKTLKVASPFGVSLAATIIIYMGRQVLATI